MGDCRISVDVAGAKKIPQAKGFYDLMEDTLNFPIKARGKFHSYIQSEYLSIDIDKKGFPLNVEVSLPRGDWTADPRIVVPVGAEMSKLRFLDYRLDISGESYFTNEKKDLLYICFAQEQHVKSFEIAENILADVNLVNELVGLWLLNLEEDYEFKAEMAFRKGAKVKSPK